MAVLANDTCARADQSGFGISSDGQVWSYSGASVTTAIANNEATFNFSTDFSYALLGTKATADSTFLMRIQQSSGSTGIGFFFRYQDVNNLYFVPIFFNRIELYKVIGGSLTQLSSIPISGYTVGTKWWIRSSIAGTSIQVKTWQDGSPEIGNWLIDITDSSILTSGQFGMNVNGGGTLSSFDNITVTDNVPSVFDKNSVFSIRKGSMNSISRSMKALLFIRKSNVSIFVRK